jgi:hypothetical protein
MAGSKVTTAVDAYAFGIMAWEIYTSKRAYAGERRSVGTPAYRCLPRMHTVPFASLCPSTLHHDSVPPPKQPTARLTNPPGLPRDAIVNRVYRTGMRPHFPAAAPPAFVSICESCWQTDPARRPTFAGIADMLERLAAQLAPSDNGGSVEGSGDGSAGYAAAPPPAAAARPRTPAAVQAAGTLPRPPAPAAFPAAARGPVAAPPRSRQLAA